MHITSIKGLVKLLVSMALSAPFGTHLERVLQSARLLAPLVLERVLGILRSVWVALASCSEMPAASSD